MGINGRRKGLKAQRVAAAVLSKWTRKKFASTPASGGLHWRNQHVAGDIVCCTEGHYFPFCVEVKSYNKIDFSHLLTPNIKDIEILDYYAQSKRDAEEVKKIPLLMMRYNGLPKEFFYLVIADKDLRALIGDHMEIRHSLHFWDKDKNIILYILRSDEFFGGYNYKDMRKKAKQYLKKKKWA